MLSAPLAMQCYNPGSPSTPPQAPNKGWIGPPPHPTPCPHCGNFLNVIHQAVREAHR